MKRLIALVVSLGILALIYWRIDLDRVWTAFATARPDWLAAGALLFVPTVTLTAWRFRRLSNNLVGFGESNRLILAASTLNMVLPSKMGDIAKAWFVTRGGHMDGAAALSLVVFEKACDMLSLLVWCVFGLARLGLGEPVWLLVCAGVLAGLAFGLATLFSTRFAALLFALLARLPLGPLKGKVERFAGAWRGMQSVVRQKRGRPWRIMALSLVIWLAHLVQIWCFIKALGGEVGLTTNLALTPLAILVGLLPMTFAGVGTRDAALIFFYQGLMAPAQAAAVGLLCTARYVVPALAGLPFFHRYMGHFMGKNLSREALKTPGQETPEPEAKP